MNPCKLRTRLYKRLGSCPPRKCLQTLNIFPHHAHPRKNRSSLLPLQSHMGLEQPSHWPGPVVPHSAFTCSFNLRDLDPQAKHIKSLGFSRRGRFPQQLANPQGLCGLQGAVWVLDASLPSALCLLSLYCRALSWHSAAIGTWAKGRKTHGFCVSLRSICD